MKNKTDKTIETNEKQDINTGSARVCRVCGCTDLDCSGCIAKTGQPCYWVEPDLCSACAMDEEQFERDWEKFGTVVDDIWAELLRARQEHHTFTTYHHGAAVIREEYEELWEQVKKKKWNKEAMRKEAIQVATTAIRFVVDLIDNEVEQ